MIRPATSGDLPRIMEIIRQTIGAMRAEGFEQWDEEYPAQRHFAADIAAGELFACERDGRVYGVVCLNREQPEEYRGVGWRGEPPCLVVHRMAVSTELRRHGVGRELMEFAKSHALAGGVRYIRTDTYSLNPKMNALFTAMGYRLAGQIHFAHREAAFNCYDYIF